MVRLALPDGRRVELLDLGDPHGRTVLLCHGTPDSRQVARTGAAAAAAAGVRLLCLSRPGYGASTATSTTPDSVAGDALAVLDLLGVEAEVAVVGMSVGALYAAALALRAPARVTALTLVAAPRPPEPGTEVVVEEFLAWRAGVLGADPDDDAALATRFLAELPEEDGRLLAVLGPGYVAQAAREALADPAGYLADARTFAGDWGLALDRVAVPASLRYGRYDERNPPDTAGRWWRERLPAAGLAVTGTTHLATLVGRWPAVLASTTRR